MRPVVLRRFFLCALIPMLFLSSAHALEYDFEDGDQGWEQINGTVVVNKGELVVSGSDGVGVMPDSDWNDEWTNYAVQCSMNMEAGPDNMGIVLRYQGPDTYYIFAIMNGRQQMEIWSRVAGAYTDELDIGFANEIGQDYIVRVVAEGSDFKIHIDDELIAEWNDDKLETGKVGVRTYSSTSHFDDIIITGPGIPGTAVEPASKLATTWAKLKG
ncbi:family 16 glycoside hydrolase [Candidatus Poribacteria bacterium]